MKNYSKPRILRILDAFFEGIRKGSIYVFFIGIILSFVLHYKAPETTSYIVSGAVTMIAAFLFICIGMLKSAHQMVFNDAVEAAVTKLQQRKRKPADTADPPAKA